MPLLIEILAAVPELPLAHTTNLPHQEPVARAGEGTPVAVILVGVLFALMMVGALVFLRERMREDRPGGAAGEDGSG